MKIGDAAVSEMTKDGIRIVMWGDGILTTIYYKAMEGAVRKDRVARHPLDAMSRVLAALALDARFIPCKIRGHDSRGRPRLVRGFELKS
jgi:hypothetical protein